jgi:AraC-like DNA-binding protein
MNVDPHLQAVVEVALDEGEPLCPWPIADCKLFSLIRLSGKMTDREVGLVFAQLVNYNNLEGGGDTNNLLHQVIQAETLVLPGGLQVRSAHKLINPSCCCGLETWRDWLRFLKTSRSPWLGHDPSPWIEKAGGLIHVWSDKKAKAFHIDFEPSKFEAELSKVQQDLSGFLARIEAWASRVGFSEPSKLSRKFDECFNVSHSQRLLPRGRSRRIH